MGGGGGGARVENVRPSIASHVGNPSLVTSSPITDDAAKVKSSATITSSTPRRPPTGCMASVGSPCVRQQDGTRQVGSLPVWMAYRIKEALRQGQSAEASRLAT